MTERAYCVVIGVLAALGSSMGEPIAAQSREITFVETIYRQYADRQFDSVTITLRDSALDWGQIGKEVLRQAPGQRAELWQAFVLEVASAAVASDGHRGIGGAASRVAGSLLDAGAAAFSGRPKSTFERDWYLAAFAIEMSIGRESPGSLSWRPRLTLDTAVRRWQEDAEVQFAAAIQEEQSVLAWLTVQGVEVLRPSDSSAARGGAALKAAATSVASRYIRLANHPELGASARLRAGVMRMVAGDLDSALRDFAALAGGSRSSDSPTAFLARLFLGRVKLIQSNPVGAEEDFALALEIDDQAWSAKVGLLTAQTLQGKPVDVATARVWLSTAHDSDPWHRYAFGLADQLGAYIGRLRRALRAVE